ncbi:hypothetical protein [Nostoc sp. JL23]|uniref:hypothetical protein n=1 Tax=Nostoc sp. JL23 TaxID=2815394 RepID=UPI001DDE0C3F|nr:hypothetical protein [Nostoc sp. JL23]MBN3878094.1 hypothetical protein [Nostoc sp. JL23]
MKIYRIRGQVSPVQENNIKTEVQTLKNSIKEVETKIKSGNSSKGGINLETQLGELKGKLRAAQATLVVAGLRVEMWDNDERLDDRLGAGKTDSVGLFEIKFTDEDFRQGFLGLKWTPNIFFNVYQGRELLGFSETRENLTLPSEVEEPPLPLNPAFVIFNEDETPSDYIIANVTIDLIDDGKVEERPRQDYQEQPITVYDILPTANSTFKLTTQTSSLTNIDNNNGSLEQMLNSVLSEVLGQNFKGDPKAFVNTLNQSFTPKQTNGRTEYEWSPRTYVGVQNDLGGTVSGAQASLYHRAKIALKDAMPLLDKLYSLNRAADRQNMEAMRAIIRTEMIELVNELGASGGPRVQRVDNLFQVLIGSAEDDDSDEIRGQLKNLADVYGLTCDRVNTVDEEQNYGNFLIIRDYLVSLRGSWNDYIEDSESGAFVGPQLVLLSQALSTIAESVQDVYRIMDMVFLGAADRQAISIDFKTVKSPSGMPIDEAFPLPDGTAYLKKDLAKLVPPMTVEGLLTWAWRFGAEEGPALAKAGGKLGIAEALAETAEKLMILVQAASFTPVRNTAFRREGVLRALRDLSFQLYQVKELAKQIIPPSTNNQATEQLSTGKISSLKRIAPSR